MFGLLFWCLAIVVLRVDLRLGFGFCVGSLWFSVVALCGGGGFACLLWFVCICWVF